MVTKCGGEGGFQRALDNHELESLSDGTYAFVTSELAEKRGTKYEQKATASASVDLRGMKTDKLSVTQKNPGSSSNEVCLEHFALQHIQKRPTNIQIVEPIRNANYEGCGWMVQSLMLIEILPRTKMR
eukprot:4099456-Amphidinium_carterae.1